MSASECKPAGAVDWDLLNLVYDRARHTTAADTDNTTHNLLEELLFSVQFMTGLALL